MNDLLIEANIKAKTPLIDFKVSGELKIEGMSVAEHPVSFYEPVFNWLREMEKQTPKTVTLTMKLEYFNTSSSKQFFNIFKMLEKIQRDGAEAKIVWIYDKADDDMIQSGKDYQSIVNVPFKFLEIA